MLQEQKLYVINTTAYHLRRYEPPSPSTWKRAPWVVAARQQKPFSIFGQVQKNKKHNYLVACLE